MNVLGTTIETATILLLGLILWLLIRGRFNDIEGRIDRLEGTVNRRFEAIDARSDRLEDSMTSRIDGLRSDVTQVALAVGAKPKSDSA